MQTTRWIVTLGAAFIGVAYSVAAIVPLIGGRVELDATPSDIVDLETDGFPSARYLRVTGGAVVWSEAVAQLRSRPDDSGRRLMSLTVPLVSPEVAQLWSAQKARGERIDATRFRLAVRFTGEQVAERWPDVLVLAESEALDEVAPLPMTVEGETDPLSDLLGASLRTRPLPNTLHESSMRGLRFERHFDSLGRTAKDLAIALVLFGVAFLFLRYGADPNARSPRGDTDAEAAAYLGAGVLDDAEGGDSDGD